MSVHFKNLTTLKVVRADWKDSGANLEKELDRGCKFNSIVFHCEQDAVKLKTHFLPVLGSKSPFFSTK